MKQILIVESSPRGPESASRRLAGKVRARLEAEYPEATMIERDLAKDKLPHLDVATLKAMTTRDPAEAKSLKDALHSVESAHGRASGIGSNRDCQPHVEFRHPPSLKAWIDHVVRVGKTFNYADAGVEGLAKRQEGDPGACIRRSL